MGLFHLIKANLMGAGKIYSVDPYKFRTSLAKEFGATEVITSEDREEIKDNIMRLTDNLGADLVVDCSGVSEGFTIALELIREGGMVLEVGIFSNSHDIPINPLLVSRMNGQFYDSLGCIICTTPMLPGESRRAGRWRWQNVQVEEGNKKECGLHFSI